MRVKDFKDIRDEDLIILAQETDNQYMLSRLTIDTLTRMLQYKEVDLSNGSDDESDEYNEDLDYILEAIVDNENIKANSLEKIANFHIDYHIGGYPICSVASNEKVSSKTLDNLFKKSESGEFGVYEYLAKNPNIYKTTLEKIYSETKNYNDETSENVMRSILNNPKANKKMIDEINHLINIETDSMADLFDEIYENRESNSNQDDNKSSKRNKHR